MVDGKFLKRDGYLIGFDRKYIVREVEERKERLFNTTGSKLMQYYPAYVWAKYRAGSSPALRYNYIRNCIYLYCIL